MSRIDVCISRQRIQKSPEALSHLRHGTSGEIRPSYRSAEKSITAEKDLLVLQIIAAAPDRMTGSMQHLDRIAGAGENIQIRQIMICFQL